MKIAVFAQDPTDAGIMAQAFSKKGTVHHVGSETELELTVEVAANKKLGVDLVVTPKVFAPYFRRRGLNVHTAEPEQFRR